MSDEEGRPPVRGGKKKGAEGAKRTKSLSRAETQNIRLGSYCTQTLERLRLERVKTCDQINVTKLQLLNEIDEIRATTSSGGHQLHDRHVGLTHSAAARRVLRPLVFDDAFYLSLSNRYAIRRVHILPEIAGLTTKSGKLPCPGNYSQQGLYFTRSTFAPILSDNVKMARHKLMTMDQDRQVLQSRERSKSRDREATEITLLSAQATKAPSDLYAAGSVIKGGKVSTLDSARRDGTPSRRRRKRRVFPATPENGQRLVEHAAGKMRQFLMRLDGQLSDKDDSGGEETVQPQATAQK